MVYGKSSIILLFVTIVLANAVEDKRSFLSLLAEVKVPERIDPAGGRCSPARKEHCQHEFSKALGSKDTLFNDIAKLTKVLEAYYTNEKLEKGLLTLCVHRADMYRCMGPQYDACTDPFVIFAQAKEKSQSMTFIEAFELSYVQKRLEFDCLGGQVQATDKYDCVLRTWKSDKYQKGMQSCQDALKKADPSRFCEAAQTFLECVGTLFKTNVCPSSELSWWECERNRVGFSIDGFCPKLTCNTVTSVEDSHAVGVAEKSKQREKRGGFVSEQRLNLYKQFAMKHPRRIRLDNAKLQMKK